MRPLAPVAAIVVLALAPHARADATTDAKAACVAASEQAQQLRTDGKLQAAREKLLACAKETCPGIVKKDCADWLGEVTQSLPSIVPTVRDEAGKDVSTGRVWVDGRLVADSLDGRAIALDPGAHVVKVETGGASREERIVLREGERNRAVTISLAPELPVPAPVVERASSGPPALAWIMGGVAVAGVATFAGFGLAGRAEADDLRAGCAPGCAARDVDAARTKLVVADVSLVVGVVAAGVATWLFLKPRDDARPPTVGLVRF